MLVHRQKAGGHGRIRTVASRCVRIRMIEPARGHHRSAGKFRPRRLHLLVLQRRSHVKYRRMHHTRSPLSATACRLLLNKLHVGESSPSSVDLSSRFQCIIELARAEYPELNVEHNSDGLSICRGAHTAVCVIKRHVYLNLVTCWILPSVCVTCPLAAFGGLISP